ncbi:MAG: alanine dehydrogenase [Rhabdochlamydiaceae bacterium]|nr:alanine dehydrogenase [Candidatus Amphrikana amoebophyrae]
MLIGIPKEVKNHEYRIGATPAMVKSLIEANHTVWIQKDAAKRIGFTNEQYINAGATIKETAEEIYDAEMIIKVKEPQLSEFDLLKEGQILFCYLHLAPDPFQTEKLLEKKVVGIAYETVIDASNRLPLLTPMSEIAGRIAIQAGAYCLQMANGGKGVLLGGIPGVNPGKVLIIGGGVVGTEAARMAMGLGADVTVLDRNLNRLRELDFVYGNKLKTLYSSPHIVDEIIGDMDLIIGAVLIPGKTAPKIITREHLRMMQPGSAVVDVSIDQGGCMATSKPTSHSDPIYEEEGIVHYCVSNMPGACAKSATIGLTNATLPYALKIANMGYEKALMDDPLLREGLNVHFGKVTNQHVALDLGYEYYPSQEVLTQVAAAI